PRLVTVWPFVALKLLAPQEQVGPQPVQGLLTPARPRLLIEVHGVLALATARQRGRAGGLVTARRCLRQPGLSRERLCIEAGRRRELLLVNTTLCQRRRLVRIGRRLLALQDQGQPGIEAGQALGLPQPLPRRVAPVALSGAEFVPVPQGSDRLGEAPLLHE